MRIEVTQEDIDEGSRGDCFACPIALALGRATGAHDLFVAHFYVRVRERCYVLPQKATTFIFDFDDGAPVKPFAFTLQRRARS